MSENIPQYGELAPTPSQPVYPPYTTAPGQYYQPAPAPAQKRGLGIAALLLAIVVFVISAIWAVANGLAVGPMIDATGNVDEAITNGAELGANPEFAALGLGVLFHVVVGTLFGVAALVMGIVAISLKRGRAQGVTAVAIAVAAPVVSYVAYSVAAASVALQGL